METTLAVLLKDWKAATTTYRYNLVFSWRRSETNKIWALDFMHTQVAVVSWKRFYKRGDKVKLLSVWQCNLGNANHVLLNLSECHSTQAKCGPVVPNGEIRGCAQQCSQWKAVSEAHSGCTRSCRLHLSGCGKLRASLPCSSPLPSSSSLIQGWNNLVN